MPRYNLLLVWPHAAYRPPPDLSRPELRAAFEAGRARRAAGADDVESGMKEWYEHREGGRLVSQAYWAGLQEGIAAPLPLALDVLGIVGSGVAAGAIRQPTSMLRRVGGAIVLAAYAAVVMRSDRRRSPRGVTAETAPVPSMQGSMWMLLGIEALHGLWWWRRHGRRPHSQSTLAAAALTRVLMRRRSWRAARSAAGTAAGA